jgi:hypothetical protein
MDETQSDLAQLTRSARGCATSFDVGNVSRVSTIAQEQLRNFDGAPFSA